MPHRHTGKTLATRAPRRRAAAGAVPRLSSPGIYHIKITKSVFAMGNYGIFVGYVVYTLVYLISRNVYLMYKKCINGDNKVYPHRRIGTGIYWVYAEELIGYTRYRLTRWISMG